MIGTLMQHAPDLARQEPGAEERDHGEAGNFHRLRRFRHGDGGAAQHEIGGDDEEDGDRALNQRRDEGNQDAAFQLRLVGDHVGGDHRLAMAGAGRVEHAIGKGEADQRGQRPWVFAHGFQRAGQRAVEALLVDVDPLEEGCQRPADGNGGFGRADAERRLGVGDAERGEEQG